MFSFNVQYCFISGVVRSESSAQSRNLNEVSMTKIAIVIVVTFVLLNMLRLILCFFEVAQMFTGQLISEWLFEVLSFPQKKV